MITVLSESQFKEKAGSIEKNDSKIKVLDSKIKYLVNNEEFSIPHEYQPIYFEYEDTSRIMGNYVFVYLSSVSRIIIPVSKENIPQHLEVNDMLNWISMQLDSIDLNKTVQKYWKLKEYKSLEQCEKDGIKILPKYKCELCEIFSEECRIRDNTNTPLEGRYTILDTFTKKEYKVWIRVNPAEEYSFAEIFCYSETNTEDKNFVELILKVLTKIEKYE